MKVFLIMWLIVSGEDIGGGPIEMSDLQACEQRAAEIIAMPFPQGATVIRVGCVTEKLPETPS